MAKAQPSLECRHIRINGTKCCAAALIDNAWCYYHDRIYREQRQKQAAEAAGRRSQTTPTETTQDYGCITVTPQLQRDQPIEFPLLEDISSIQLAISRVLTALATNTIDPKRAGLLLYGLQIAAQNLPKSDLQRWNTVSDVARTREGFHVALAEPAEPRSESFTAMAKRLRLTLRQLDDLQLDDLQKDEKQ